MLVEMVVLRKDGVKLTREQIRAAPVRRAELEMFRINGTVRATFGSPCWLLEPAAIMTMRGTDFIVVGIERAGKMWDERKVPQAWWCRLVVDEKATPLGPAAELNSAAAVVAEA